MPQVQNENMGPVDTPQPYGLGAKVAFGGLVACAALTAIALAMPSVPAAVPEGTAYTFTTTGDKNIVTSMTKPGQGLLVQTTNINFVVFPGP
jgi:hypothetical protein